MKYTFSDEEEIGSDAPSTRRSNRHSGISTPAEAAGPTFTASGRQVRSRHGGAYGETILSGQQDGQGSSAKTYDGQGETDEEGAITGHRTRGKLLRNGVGQSLRSRNCINNYNAVDAMDDESDATSSGGEWEGGDDDDDAEEQGPVEDSDEDTAMSDNSSDIHEENDTDRHGSLIVSLRYQQKKGQQSDTTAEAGTTSETPVNQPRSPQLSNGRHKEPAEVIKETSGQDQFCSTIMGEPAKGPGLANGVHDLAFKPKQTDYPHSSNDSTAT